MSEGTLYDDAMEAMMQKLEENVEDVGLTFDYPDTGRQGIGHVVGPEQGLTQPGMTIVCGGLGFLPSANVGAAKALFEPVHGTAPDVAGEGVASPSATVLSAAMPLEHLGHDEEGARVRTAVEGVLEDGPRPPDLGGSATTAEVADAVVARL